MSISRTSAEKMIGLIVKHKDKMKCMCNESYLPENMKSNLNHLIDERIAAFS